MLSETQTSYSCGQYQLHLRGEAVADVMVSLARWRKASWGREGWAVVLPGPGGLSSYPRVCGPWAVGECTGQPGSAGPDMYSLASSGSIQKMRKISSYWIWWWSRSGRERSLGKQEKHLIELLAKVARFWPCSVFISLQLIFCFIITAFMLFGRFIKLAHAAVLCWGGMVFSWCLISRGMKQKPQRVLRWSPCVALKTQEIWAV